jgi:hypothetical protein
MIIPFLLRYKKNAKGKALALITINISSINNEVATPKQER